MKFTELFLMQKIFFCLVIDQTNEKKNTSNEHNLIYYEELKTTIINHQAVMK